MSTKPPAARSLAEYIAEIGEEKFAADYGVTVRAAQSYRYGQRKPRRAVAKRIVEDRKNPLTWESIYFAEATPAPGAQRRRRARA